MGRVVVTGGSGKAGRAVVRDLLAHGEDVLSVDLVRSPELACEQLVADLTDFGETVEALRGAEAVVHLAAIPAPGLRPDELTFRVNTTSTYNVFSAAPLLGLRRVASSTATAAASTTRPGGSAAATTASAGSPAGSGSAAGSGGRCCSRAGSPSCSSSTTRRRWRRGIARARSAGARTTTA